MPFHLLDFDIESDFVFNLQHNECVSGVFVRVCCLLFMLIAVGDVAILQYNTSNSHTLCITHKPKLLQCVSIHALLVLCGGTAQCMSIMYFSSSTKHTIALLGYY